MNMDHKDWREIVEIVGIVSIVASLLLLAIEVRQSNRIANAEMELALSTGYAEAHLERATNPEFARLFAKLRDPESHLITATEAEQIEGLAWFYMNILWSAQAAYDDGVLTRQQFDAYLVDMRWFLENYPAMRADFVEMYESMTSMHGLEIFEPIRELIEAENTRLQ